MKAGRKMSDVRRLLHEKGLDAMMVENCGMEEERIYLSTRGDTGRGRVLFPACCKEKKDGEAKGHDHICRGRTGAEDLITVPGQRLLQEADIIVYAGLSGQSGTVVHGGGGL